MQLVVVRRWCNLAAPMEVLARSEGFRTVAHSAPAALVIFLAGIREFRFDSLAFPLFLHWT